LKDLHDFVLDKASHNLDLIEKPVGVMKDQSNIALYVASQKDEQMSTMSITKQMFCSNLSNTGNAGSDVYDSGFNQDWNSSCEQDKPDCQTNEAQLSSYDEYYYDLAKHQMEPLTMTQRLDDSDCQNLYNNNNCQHLPCDVNCDDNHRQIKIIPNNFPPMSSNGGHPVEVHHNISHVHIPPRPLSVIGTDCGSAVEDINNDYDSVL
jgi:hypothetical protein